MNGIYGKDLLHLTKLISSSQVQMIIGTLAGVDETTPDIKENLGKVQKVISEIDQDRFPFLEHPGNIHFLFPSDGLSLKEYSLAAEKSPTFSRQLLLHDRMVLDHQQIHYKDAMEKTVFRKREMVLLGKREKKPENSLGYFIDNIWNCSYL